MTARLAGGDSDKLLHCLVQHKGRARKSRRHCPPVSVVINTDNRLTELKRALAALKFQAYDNFEVCVIAGPTRDGTHDFLGGFGDRLKLAACARRNLSRSRNIGIALSSGEIVAFLDDDAVPEPEWLTQIVESYDNDKVGAVGGFVHDNTGIGFQARYMTVDRLGHAREDAEASPEHNFPGSPRVPHLLGTNASFRRRALLGIGGFDEHYEYFLDETDVCLRINDAGHGMVQRPDAFVHHKFAPSDIRCEQKTIRSWYPLIKNRIYFGFSHARGALPLDRIVEEAMIDRDKWRTYVTNAVKAGLLSYDDLERFELEARAALEDGLDAATKGPRQIGKEMLEAYRADFRPFSRTFPDGRQQVLVYLDPSPGQSPVGEGQLDLVARQMASRGHQVHLVVRKSAVPFVDFDNGIWVHNLGTGTVVSGGRDEALVATLKRLTDRRQVDAAYCRTAERESLQYLSALLSS